MMIPAKKHFMRLRRTPRKSVSHQQGIILLLALIVLIAMSLAGVALVRSVDTANVAAGNLGFRQTTLNETDVGIETALVLFRPGQPLADPALILTTMNNRNYSAQMLPADARGIPTALLTQGTFDSTFTAARPTATTGANPSQIRYVIDRLCLNVGPVDPDTCRLTSLSPADASVDTRNEYGLSSAPLYRITARVDGPKNTTTYSQVIISN
jgi:type IV pilus assembly protein PilX